jgi:glycosyltransferase involved in cell wall biosynthesis
MNASTSATPLVTIGLPVYNGANYIRQAIDSILAQTFKNFELIISDNCSTDDTVDICKEYAARDPRVRVSRNERNLGAVHNYNKVIHEARGKYFRHAAHDDVLAPTNIERCVEVLEREPEVALCYPRMQTIDAEGRILKTFSDSLPLRQKDPVARWRRFHQLCNDGSMCDPVFGLFRTSVLRTTRLLGSFISADMIWLGEVALRGQIHEVPKCLFFERVHEGTSVAANPTLDDRAAWFDPENRGKLSNYLPYWVWLREHLRSIELAPLDVRRKILCTGVMLPWMWRYKRPLVISLVKVAMIVLGFRNTKKAKFSDYHAQS